MTLKKTYFLFVALWFVSLAVLLVLAYQSHKPFFVAVEILCLLSAIFFAVLYRKFLKPVDSIRSAALLLKEKDFNSSLPHTGQQDMDDLIQVYNQMAGKLREERIQHEEKNYFLDMLIEASPSAILVFSLDQKIIQANKAALKLLSVEAQSEITGKQVGQLKTPLAHKLAELETNQPQVLRLDSIHRYKANKSSFIDKGFQRHFIMLEELTGELLKAEKDAYGKVIRFMGHEVNNTVAAVNSILDSLKESCLKQEPAYMRALQVSVERNQNLCKFMDNYSQVVKIEHLQKENFPLLPVIEATQLLFQQELKKKNINYKCIANGEKPHLIADKGLMEQVLINILKNSIEAISQGGFIEVELNKSSLIYRDNGCGINESNKEHIFSPFYTNKSNGQGIGLTFIREVLMAHDFAFKLETKKDTGFTEFWLGFDQTSIDPAQKISKLAF